MIEFARGQQDLQPGPAQRMPGLREVSLTLERGGITVFKGPSGSGKTTLLTLVGCLARPTAGGSRSMAACCPTAGTVFDRGAAAHLRLRVPAIQSDSRIDGPGQRDAAGLSAGETALSRTVDAARRHGSTASGLARKGASSRVEWLSGGEAQRTALARALINDPAVLIADEPTANLDSALSREVLALLGELAAQGRTVLISSHDPLIIEATLVNRLIELRDGQILGAALAVA
jgi:putative ABC transport system ATP-binding protein